MNNFNNNGKGKDISGIVSVIFLGISAVLTVVLFIASLKTGETFLKSFISAPILGLMLGGIIPGLCHIPAVNEKCSSLLLIPFLGWMLWLFIVLGLPFYGGWVFMLIDFIRYRRNKREE